MAPCCSPDESFAGKFANSTDKSTWYTAYNYSEAKKNKNWQVFTRKQNTTTQLNRFEMSSYLQIVPLKWITDVQKHVNNESRHKKNSPRDEWAAQEFRMQLNSTIMVPQGYWGTLTHAAIQSYVPFFSLPWKRKKVPYIERSRTNYITYDNWQQMVLIFQQ